MINLKVPKKLIEYCQNQIDTYDFGQRSEFNGDKEQQLTGIIGQSVVMFYFDLGFVDGSKGFDDGVDLVYSGVKIDVKTMGRKSNVKPYFTNNFVAFQDKFHPDAYIFCSYHKTLEEITICGWVSKEQFHEKRKFYPKGSIRTRGDGTEFTSGSDLYEIDMMDINDVFNFYDLKNQIKQYSLTIKNK
jgi:hypothetical protein